MEPSVFAWLYRNDCTWLRDVGTPTKIERRSNHASVAWDERDRHLAAAVERAALNHHKLHLGQRLRRHDLLEAVPELTTRMRHLDRLPLTLKAVTIALARSKSKPIGEQVPFV